MNEKYCLIKRWIPPIYEYGTGHISMNIRTVQRGTGCFENKFTTRGLFHEWGLDIIETSDSVSSFSVALVELDDGTIEKVLPQNIKFIDKYYDHEKDN